MCGRWATMTDMQPKKMIILDILNILRKHSDEDHRLSQQQIQVSHRPVCLTFFEVYQEKSTVLPQNIMILVISVTETQRYFLSAIGGSQLDLFPFFTQLSCFL